MAFLLSSLQVIEFDGDSLARGRDDHVAITLLTEDI